MVRYGGLLGSIGFDERLADARAAPTPAEARPECFTELELELELELVAVTLFGGLGKLVAVAAPRRLLALASQALAASISSSK